MTRPQRRKEARRLKQRRLSRERIKQLPELANCESPIERRLLSALRSALSADVRIRVQVPIGPYRADCMVERGPLRVVVEADGEHFHNSPAQIAYDLRRDAWMRGRGYQVQRFNGSQINRDPRACAAVVTAMVSAEVPASRSVATPKPPRAGRGRRRAERQNRRLRALNAHLLLGGQPIERTAAPPPRTSIALW